MVESNDETRASCTSPYESSSTDVATSRSPSASQVSFDPDRKIDPFDVDDPEWMFEKILSVIINRGAKDGTGPLSPHVTLAWKDLSVYGDDVGRASQQDVSSIFSDIFAKLRKLWIQPSEKRILYECSGFLEPGEMLLVLGPPSSGCTTLLKMLSGDLDSYRRWSGSINYSGISLDTMRQQFASMLTFNDAIDHHFPYLTVSQTLEFAASTKTPRIRIDGMSRKQYIQGASNVLMTIFGLKHTANTRVGNDFVRGVPGGERRRVSIAEMVCVLNQSSNTPPVLTSGQLLNRSCVTCWDNPTKVRTPKRWSTSISSP